MSNPEIHERVGLPELEMRRVFRIKTKPTVAAPVRITAHLELLQEGGIEEIKFSDLKADDLFVLLDPDCTEKAPIHRFYTEDGSNLCIALADPFDMNGTQGIKMKEVAELDKCILESLIPTKTDTIPSVSMGCSVLKKSPCGSCDCNCPTTQRISNEEP